METMEWVTCLEKSGVKVSWNHGHRSSLRSHACMTTELLTQTKTPLFADLGKLTCPTVGRRDEVSELSPGFGVGS